MKANKKIIGILLIAAIIVLAALYAYFKMESSQTANQQAAIKQAVINSAIQCCSIEGNYPDNLKYLLDNYGLQIDGSKYIVVYEAIGSNVLPQVTVLRKGE